jgi:hypothetical protein
VDRILVIAHGLLVASGAHGLLQATDAPAGN